MNRFTLNRKRIFNLPLWPRYVYVCMLSSRCNVCLFTASKSKLVRSNSRQSNTLLTFLFLFSSLLLIFQPMSFLALVACPFFFFVGGLEKRETLQILVATLSGFGQVPTFTYFHANASQCEWICKYYVHFAFTIEAFPHPSESVFWASPSWRKHNIFSGFQQISFINIALPSALPTSFFAI